MSYYPASTVIWDLVRWLDDPVVIGVVERVAGNLLTLRTDAAIFVSKRVFLHMRMQEDLCLPMAEGQGVEIADF